MLRSGENVTLVCSSESAFDQLHLLRERGNLGRGPPQSTPGRSSLWVLGPQPTAGSAGALAPSLALPTHGQTPANHCSCLSQVRNLFLAHAFLFLFIC